MTGPGTYLPSRTFLLNNESCHPPFSFGRSYRCSGIKVNWPNYPYVRNSNKTDYFVVISTHIFETDIKCYQSFFHFTRTCRFLCSECVDEMHKLGHMVKMGAVVIHVSTRISFISVYVHMLNKCLDWATPFRTTSGTPTVQPLATTRTFAESLSPDTTLACWWYFDPFSKLFSRCQCH